MDIISDYLRLLWNHALKQLASNLGKRQVDQIPFMVVVTVPAMWKGYARSRMRTAVTNAGILDERAAGPTTFNFVSEPEAAALATLTDLQSTCSIQVRYQLPRLVRLDRANGMPERRLPHNGRYWRWNWGKWASFGMDRGG